MRHAIMSDIHGNYEALKVVIKDAEKKGINQYISLGDVVGYGPQSHDCINMLREKKVTSVMGNHDAGVILKTDLTYWRGEALVTWQDARKKLPDADLQWLLERPYYHFCEDFVCVHGSPNHPIEEYIQDAGVAKQNLDFLFKNNLKICFFGHTHHPTFIMQSNKWIYPADERYILHLTKNSTYFINPGSVGQPRDNDPRASYLIYDSNAQTIEIQRVSYNIKKTQQRILACGYAPMLAQRLIGGW